MAYSHWTTCLTRDLRQFPRLGLQTSPLEISVNRLRGERHHGRLGDPPQIVHSRGSVAALLTVRREQLASSEAVTPPHPALPTFN